MALERHDEDKFNRLALCASWLNQHCRFMKVSVSEYNFSRIKSAIKCLKDEEVIDFLKKDRPWNAYIQQNGQR